MLLAAAVALTLDSVITEEMEATKTQRAAVVVVQKDRETYAKGFGGASVDTPFELGSLTKPFTAITVLTWMKPDDKVSFCSSKIGQLLSHTAGLRDEPDDLGSSDDGAMERFVRTWTADDYCIFPKGVFSYSNASFTLAGLALQRKMRKPFADLVADAILKPVGMTHSGFRPQIRTPGTDSRQWPAGGLYASARDVGRFALAVMNEKNIPRRVVRAMTTPHATINSRQRYGYGMFLFDDFIEHAGANPGYTAILRMKPQQKCAVIILANSDAFLRKTADEAMKECGETAPAPILQTSALPAADMQQYTGTYSQPKRWTIEVEQRDGTLTLKQFGREFELQRIAGDRLGFTPAPGAPVREVTFHRDAAGRIDLLQMDIWAFRRLGSHPSLPTPGT
jgi:CubicO group peptidase (beta-lactamase class C family)